MKKIYLTLLTLLLFVTLAACSGQDNAETELSYIPFSSEELGLSLEYPEAWSTFDAFGGLTLTSNPAIIEEESFENLGDAGYVNIIVGELAVFNFQIGQEIQPDEAMVALGVYKQLLEQNGQSFQVVEPLAELEAADISSGAKIVVRSMVDGKQLHTILAVIIDEGQIALISSGSLEYKAEDYRPTFEQILASIQVFPPKTGE